MRAGLKSITVAGILIILLVGLTDICHAQPTFNIDSAVQLDEIPATGTFFSIQGDVPPFPVPLWSLPIYYDGVADQYWYDDVSFDRMTAGRSFMAESVPSPGDTNGSGYSTDSYTNTYNIPTYNLTTNAWQYTNFWLAINCSPTNSLVGLVNIIDTLPGYYYAILTNMDLNKTTTNWIAWTTLLATNTNTPAPPIGLSSTNLNFRGKIVLPHGSYITNGLAAYWKLNDATGTNAADSSGNGNTLVLTNSPYWGPGCSILNGSNQFGDAGASAAEIVYHDMTICAWINQTSNAFKGIVDKSWNGLGDPGYFGGWGLWITNDGHLLFHGGQDCVDGGPYKVIPGQWTFVAVVWHTANNNADFYVNGILNDIKNNPNTQNTATYGLRDVLIGNLQNNTNNGANCFNGSMRDVVIYSNALTAAQIHTNFLNTEYNTNVSQPDLLYYKMTEFNPANPTNFPFSLTDSSIHGGTTGTYEGFSLSEIWTNNPAGISNAALHFSGGNGTQGTATHIDTSNSVLFNFTTNSFTINLWIDPYTPDGYLVGNSTYLSNGWFMAEEGSKLFFGSETPGLETALYTINTVPTWSNTEGVYTMVTVTRDGTNTPLVYLNTVLTPMSGSFANPASSGNTLKFSIGASTNVHDLDGNLWLPQIWSRVLSTNEIINLYQEQLLNGPWP